MADPDLKNLTKKERKEYTKQLREQQGSQGKMKGYLIKLAIFIIAVIVIGGIAFVFTRPVKEKPQVGEAIASQGGAHIEQGSTQHKPYNSNPPTSGPMWPQPARCEIYSKEVADEAVVHSIEHGAVWLSYKDKSNKELVKNLTKLVKEKPSKLLLSPRSKNDSNIALVSWTRLLKLEEFDADKISAFVSANKSKSPEGFGPC